MNQSDSFTGLWAFDPARSKLSTPAPKGWTQQIEVMDGEVRIREEIVRSDGQQSIVAINAKFDGTGYLVSGSPAADTIAYRRADKTITGIGRKGGNISLRETIVVSPEDERLTLTYSIFVGDREVANGVAIFQKSAARIP